MATLTRRDFIKLSFYSFVGEFFVKKWPLGWVSASGRELPGQFNYWGQSDLIIGNLEIPFSRLPPFLPHINKRK